MKKRNKDINEHYNRKEKESDESFCSSCGAVIKSKAVLCPKCGVGNINSQNLNKKRGSVGWLIFWIIIFWPVAIYYGITRRWS